MMHYVEDDEHEHRFEKIFVFGNPGTIIRCPRCGLVDNTVTEYTDTTKQTHVYTYRETGAAVDKRRGG